jgi:methyl-accepting chemotaxis protein
MDIVQLMLGGGTGAVVVWALMFERQKRMARDLEAIAKSMQEMQETIKELSDRILKMEVASEFINPRKP